MLFSTTHLLPSLIRAIMSVDRPPEHPSAAGRSTRGPVLAPGCVLYCDSLEVASSPLRCLASHSALTTARPALRSRRASSSSPTFVSKISHLSTIVTSVLFQWVSLLPLVSRTQAKIRDAIALDSCITPFHLTNLTGRGCPKQRQHLEARCCPQPHEPRLHRPMYRS